MGIFRQYSLSEITGTAVGITGRDARITGKTFSTCLFVRHWPYGTPVDPFVRKNAVTKKRKPIKQPEQNVGRGQPPKRTQFKEGQSGNLKGRPKGSKNLSTLIMEAARDHSTVNVGGVTRRISNIQATTMQLATKAASGNPAAMAKLLDWVDEIETRAAAKRPNEFSLSEADVEVLRAAYERMTQCEPNNSKA